MADDRKYQYICDEGHEMVSFKELRKCLAIVKGSPCKGKLTRFGPGSKTQTKDKT